MATKTIQEKINEGALDFEKGVRPLLEEQLNATIHSVEKSQNDELRKKLDQVGIDAFYVDKRGDIRGLASRMNYHDYVAERPCFTLRYARKNQWNRWEEDCEYQRKLRIANATEQFVLFPKLHVESFSLEEASGKITWSYMAETKDLVNFIQENLRDKRKVRIFEPKTGEPRKVVAVSINAFLNECKLDQIKSMKD